MTNLEKYENEIKLYAYAKQSWAVVNREIKSCSDTNNCIECMFCGSESCAKARIEWLQAEYKEQEVDWSKVAVDTHILISADGKKWKRRYFAKFENSRVYAWSNGSTSWSSGGSTTRWKYAKLADEKGGNND